MAGDDFEKLGDTDKPLYGPRGILVCGCSASGQEGMLRVFARQGLGDLPVIFAHEELADKTVQELLLLPDRTGAGKSSGLVRAVIVSGITERELSTIMAAFRSGGMPKQIWATLTPVSENWRMRRLLCELTAEDDAVDEKS